MSGDTGNCKNRKIKRTLIVTQGVKKAYQFRKYDLKSLILNFQG